MYIYIAYMHIHFCYFIALQNWNKQRSGDAFFCLFFKDKDYFPAHSCQNKDLNKSQCNLNMVIVLTVMYHT